MHKLCGRGDIPPRPVLKPSGCNVGSGSPCTRRSCGAGLLLGLLLAVTFAIGFVGALVPWPTGLDGIRIGEAQHPGHRRRAAKGHALAMNISNLRLRSHNLGGIRHWDRKQRLWDPVASPDVGAYQETWADAKDILDTTRHLDERGYRSHWSAPGPPRGQGIGSLVTALRPIVARPLFDGHFDTEAAHLWNTSRVAGAWVETRKANDGIGVISFYGVSGGNADAGKRGQTERLLTALMGYLGPFFLKPLFICMDANLTPDRSEVLTALVRLGWVDVAAGLGPTFRSDPSSNEPNSKIDYVFANPEARKLVAGVELHWIPGYQHAAIDISLHLSLSTGPGHRLITPRRLPPLDPLCAGDAEKFDLWAHTHWKEVFAASHSSALEAGDTEAAWQLCETFDAACLRARLEHAGFADSGDCSGRGGVPKKALVRPTCRHIKPRAGPHDALWHGLEQWLARLHDLRSQDTLEAELLFATLWRIVCSRFSVLLASLWEEELSPHLASDDWWLELQARLTLTRQRRDAAAAERATAAKRKWATAMRKLPTACKYLKGTTCSRTGHLVDKDSGEITVVVSRMHDLLLKAWQPLFQLYADSPEPTWDAFRAEYCSELDGWYARCPQDLPANALERAVRGRNPAKVGGTDGWTTAEGHLLPAASFAARQSCLSAVADGARWPSPLLFGTVPMMPKSDTGFPEDQRPLTCLSLWSVSWDKAIYNLSKNWLDELLPCQMRGARPDAMTMDIAWVVTLLFEHAHLYQQSKLGYFLDREKCFDRLPWSILYALEGSTGFPTQWSAADQRLNSGLRTAFRLGPLVGPFWSSTNAFRQGLASSVRRVSLLMGIWVRRQVSLLPASFVGNFFDDCLVVNNSAEERQRSMDESDRFDVLTGQKIGHRKTVGFVLPGGDAPLFSRGVALKQVAADKLLGVLVPADGLRDSTLQDTRVLAAEKLLPPILKLPITLEEKAKLISLKTAGARYGLEIEEPSPECAHSFDQQVLQGLCGFRALRCKATAMCLAWRGHRLFLEMAVPFQAFDTAHRQLQRSAQIRDLFLETWEFRDAHDLWEGAGIVSHLARQCKKLGWQWTAAFGLEATHDLDIDLRCPVRGWYQHRLRIAIRQALLSNAPARKDLHGIQEGVNYELTTRLLMGRSLSLEQRCRLRFLFEGRVATAERASKHTGCSAICPNCDMDVTETSVHVSQVCPAFAAQRRALLAATTQVERDSWPACFWNAGIVPYDPLLAAANRELGHFSCHDGPAPPASSSSSSEVWLRDGRLVVAGDGACSHQGLPVARAGCGAYFGPEHRLNFAFALEGPLQDSDRAELRTLVRVARWTPSATEYLTDNEAVLLGFAKLLEGHSQPWNDHHDLWHALGQVLHSRGWDLLRVSFVKGHATELDVALGRASPREALWNAEADNLAVAGAALHALPQALVLRFQKQASVTTLMQRTLLELHAERTRLWQSSQPADPGGQHPDADRAADPLEADEDAARALQDDPPRQLDVQHVLQNPQTALPRYCWAKPDGGTRCRLQPLPSKVGPATLRQDRHKGCSSHNPWIYGYGLLEPLFWFWASLRWVDEANASSDVVQSTSFMELAIAFQLLTGVLAADPKHGASPTMQQRVHWFRSASKRLEAIIGGSLVPGEWLPTSDVLRRLRFQHGPGVSGRIVLPEPFWQHFCAVLVRSHLEVPHVPGKHRQLHWKPNFDRPPPALWCSGAPVGFEETQRWLRLRSLPEVIAEAAAGDGAADPDDGRVRVRQPAPSTFRRVRGKRPDDVLPPPAPVIETPLPKARAAIRPVRPSFDELSAEEQNQLRGFSGVARNQMLKLVVHNRTAVANGKHFVERGHQQDTIGQIRCRDCGMGGRWAEWRFFSSIAKCKREQARQPGR